jgi:hypothetical protein
MDDSFAYRTTLPAGPRVQPWVIKTAVVSILLVLGVGLFARWVVMSERESFARGYHPVLPSLEVGQIEGTADLPGTDDEAREATRVALAAARAAAAEGGSFLAADPVTLSTLQPGYTFVDGPSTMPEIVSVEGNRRAWAAAVLGPTGTCFWIRAEAGGPVVSGTSSVCTGAAILRGSGLVEGGRSVAASR